LPIYAPQKLCLPKRSDYIGALSWLYAVREKLGESFVFALDEALMCLGYFRGRSDEFVVWGYGNNDLAVRFNGVVVLGETVDYCNVKEKNGLLYTDFNRTIADALAMEEFLDMQGITEALGWYYDHNGESFEGIVVAPEYKESFEKLLKDAIRYYES